MSVKVLSELYVEVTAADIEAGRRHSVAGCPIARAVRRQYPGSMVAVNQIFITLDSRYSYRQPDWVGRWIQNFDSGWRVLFRRKVQPIRFRAELAEAWLEPGEPLPALLAGRPI